MTANTFPATTSSSLGLSRPGKDVLREDTGCTWAGSAPWWRMSSLQHCLSASVSHTHHPAPRAQQPWSPHRWPESELLAEQIHVYHCPSAQMYMRRGSQCPEPSLLKTLMKHIKYLYSIQLYNWFHALLSMHLLPSVQLGSGGGEGRERYLVVKIKPTIQRVWCVVQIHFQSSRPSFPLSIGHLYIGSLLILQSQHTHT